MIMISQAGPLPEWFFALLPQTQNRWTLNQDCFLLPRLDMHPGFVLVFPVGNKTVHNTLLYNTS